MTDTPRNTPTRPVWLTPDDFKLSAIELAILVQERFMDAPTDAVDAAHRAVRASFVGKVGESEAICVIADSLADNVLRALGGFPLETT